MNEENKSKLLIGTLVAVITLVIAVVGATYAFFSLNVSGDTTNTNVDIETGTADVVTIEQGAENIHINLAVSDMTEDNPNKAYYATDTEDNYKLSEEEGTLTFATITGTNKEASDCTAKVTITMDTGNDSMGKVLQEGDAILYITSGKTEETVDLYDLLTEELPTSVTKEIEIELSVSESAEASITGYLKVNNTEFDQSYLAGKTLNITITVGNLVCGNASKPAIEQILANSTSGTLDTKNELKIRNEELTSAGVAEEDLDTLRRFTGTTTDVKDNYICFGTSDTEECLNSLDQYMYRIIGIDETSNQIKIIKATKMMNGIHSQFAWTSSSNGNWEVSEAYKYLNSPEENENEVKSHFVGNPYYSYMKDINWTNLIVAHPTWPAGATPEIITFVNPGAYVYERSKKLENGNPIGLMYASDYLYAGEQDTTNWLFIQNGLNGTKNTGTRRDGGAAIQPNSETEWTMAEHTSSSQAISIKSSGKAGVYSQKSKYAMRPAFYLDGSKVMLGGEGSMETPYYVTNVS